MQTLLLTDVEGSTRLWETKADVMNQVLARHDEIADGLVSERGGEIVKARGEGDSLFCVLPSVDAAIDAAIAIQRAFAEEHWSGNIELRVRIAIALGPVAERAADYYGPVVNRCARMRGTAHGGQVLLTSSAAEAVVSLPERAELVDLGRHRLRDLDEAERTFQVAHPALGREFPPLRSLEQLRHNLPVEHTSFVGRAEFGEILHSLSSSKLVTLHGPGGAGKTRLALQVAAEAATEGAVWFVDLALVGDNYAVLDAIAAAASVRVDDNALRSLIDAFIEPTLVVLDNCEHVRDGCATTCRSLLDRAPTITILATSRVPLDVAGETLIAVGPLEVGGMDSDGVRLFCDRASPGVAADLDDLATVKQICERLDGLPLAIELAAARTRAFDLDQLARMLDDQLVVLTTGTSPHERHQTLEAAIRWGYELLEPTEQRLLRYMAVLAGPAELEAVQAVCGEGVRQTQVAVDLAALVDASMVVVRRGVPTRYTLLNTVRAFADAALSGEERSHATDALVSWAVGFAESANGDEIASAAPNLSAAMKASAASSNVKTAAPIAVALVDHWVHRGALGHADRVLTGALDKAEGYELRALFGKSLATIKRLRLRPDDAILLLESLVTEAPPDRRSEIELSLAVALGEAGDHERATSLLESCSPMLASREDRHLAAKLGAKLAIARGDLEQALDALERALIEAETLADTSYRQAETLNTLANLEDQMGQHELAKAHYDHALELLERDDELYTAAIVRMNRADIHLRFDDNDACRQDLRRALDAFVEADATRLVGIVLTRVAALATLDERWENAALLWGASQSATTGVSDETMDGLPFDPAAKLVEHVGAAAHDQLVSAGQNLEMDDALRLARSVLQVDR